MEEFVLERPSAKYAAQIEEYRKEFLEAGDPMAGAGALRRTEDPYEYIEICKNYEDPSKVPQDRVLATQFLFIRKNDDKLVGMIQVRHRFNDYLEKYAGHIGYSVRPCERRKGYAKKMLAEALLFCKEIGIEKALVTCDEDNIGSEKTILANGGVLESIIYEPDEKVNIKRYWIDIK